MCCLGTGGNDSSPSAVASWGDVVGSSAGIVLGLGRLLVSRG